jgi:hypothetical protein
MNRDVPPEALERAAYGVRFVAERDGLRLPAGADEALARGALTNALATTHVLTRDQLLAEREPLERRISQLRTAQGHQLNELDRLRRELAEARGYTPENTS